MCMCEYYNSAINYSFKNVLLVGGKRLLNGYTILTLL